MIKHGDTIRALSGSMKEDELKSFCDISTPPEVQNHGIEASDIFCLSLHDERRRSSRLRLF